MFLARQQKSTYLSASVWLSFAWPLRHMACVDAGFSKRLALSCEMAGRDKASSIFDACSKLYRGQLGMDWYMALIDVPFSAFPISGKQLTCLCRRWDRAFDGIDGAGRCYSARRFSKRKKAEFS